MVGEVVPVAVDASSTPREFWNRFHVFRRARQAASRPDDPLNDDGNAEALMKRPDPLQFHDRYEVFRDGAMLGWLEGTAATPENPEYATNKHLYEADLYVLPAHRRGGIGASFLPVVVEMMERHGATTVGFWAEEQSGHEFMRWVGAEPKLRSIESRLKLSEVDWPMMERWVAEGQARSPQAKLEIHDGPIPEDLRADYAPQLSSILNTIPFENLDHGEIVVTPEVMREFYARNEVSGDVQATVLVREPNGDISGLTDTGWAAYHRTIVHQWFTGVRPDARGRGIGKWIKAAMLLHLRDLYPEAQWMSTDNAGSNAPMLKINRAMGFKAYREGTAYQITRDDLARRLTAL